MRRSRCCLRSWAASFFGVCLFKLPRLRRVVDPLLLSYYAVPIFVVYPVLIVIFGLNRWPLVAIGFLFGVVAMAANTLNGLERVPRVLLRTARAMRMSTIDEIRLITLPASLPFVFTGVKLAVVYAFIAVIAGEFVLAGSGFGFRIAYAYNNFDNPTHVRPHAAAAPIRRHAEHAAAHGRRTSLQPHPEGVRMSTLLSSPLKPAHQHRKWSDGALLVIALLALWQMASSLLGAEVLPGPWLTFLKLKSIMSDDDFPENLRVTSVAFALGFAISCIGGVCLGLVLGARRLAGDIVEPILMAFYAIPKITLYPVVLLMFGLGLYAKVTFGVIHGIIPITIFTMNAVRNMRPVFARTARACRLSPVAYARYVLLPAAVPEVLAGLRIGFSLTLLGTLIGEMFASQSGIGHMLMIAMGRNDSQTIMALASLLFIFATVVNLALLKWHQHLVKAP